MIDCPMELAGSCRMERERKPGAQEIMWHQSNLKNGMKKTRNSLQSLCEPALFAEELEDIFIF